MPQAAEIESVAPGTFLWRVYDPSVKADLFSTAVETGRGRYLIDPIPLSPAGKAELASGAQVAGIVVTNENHERAAAQFAEEYQVPVYLSAALKIATKLPSAVAIRGNCFPTGMTAIPIEGGPAGELAVHFAAGDGTIVIGDALINFEPYGFALLPAKYCTNFKLMRRSLAKLLDFSFERMLFAHGLPILSRARERLEQLLKEHR